MTQKKTWTSLHRRKLSAIRTPHRTDPKDFYYSAAEAWSALEGQGPLPAKLDPRTEFTRWGGLMATRGISWSGSAGRCFTDEFCNPLIALWVEVGGWDFVWELVFMEARLSEDEAIWYGLRRYVFREGEAEYRAMQEKLAPRFHDLVQHQKMNPDAPYKCRDRLAFVFSRDGAWCDELLRGAIKRRERTGEVAMLVAATQDATLALQAKKDYLWSNLYFVFDMVESLGAEAAPILALLTPSGAQDKKRVEQALRLAKELK